MTVIPVAENSPFGLDNLPYGVFSAGDEPPRVGTRIGDCVLDLSVALRDETFATASLNAFMAQGPARWAEVRAAVTAAAASDVPAEAVRSVHDVTLHLPFEVADYVDSYASEHHAANLGRLLRPGAEPLTPNWKHLPVGYRGRAGTVVVSGTPVTRPSGQRQPVGTAAFAGHVFGAFLVNDWSARDIQAWEYQPLGPHLGKSFATSISPWVVPLAALELLMSITLGFAAQRALTGNASVEAHATALQALATAQ